jgi:hypothetical protein
MKKVLTSLPSTRADEFMNPEFITSVKKKLENSKSQLKKILIIMKKALEFREYLLQRDFNEIF